MIRTANLQDLPEIANLERRVEDPRLAASAEVLRQRLHLFPEAFLVAVEGDQIVGYLEAIRLFHTNFQRFEEIEQYEQIHDPHGDILYISFMAVAPEHRRRGIASEMMNAAENIASRYLITRIRLMALPTVVELYRHWGFRTLRKLPHYLPNLGGDLMEKSIVADKA